jgi:endonuclease YncB( thermonuclease family)
MGLHGDSLKTDRYCHEIGKVIVDGLNNNIEQIRCGLAWHFQAHQREQSPEDRQTYARPEQAASVRHLRLWHEIAQRHLGCGGIR